LAQTSRSAPAGFSPASKGLNGYEEIARILSAVNPEWRRESIVGLSCLLDVDVYMRCQLLRDSDATSMASSLELRVPLVDLKVAEFSRSCVDDFKLRTGGGDGGEYHKSGAKRVLIHALRDVLPADVARRPKRGFTIPYKHWLETSFQPLIEETCSRRAMAARGLLDPDLGSKLARDESAQRWAGWPFAWSLMILELWCLAVIDAPGPLINPQTTQISQSQPLSA
jgi:asparagine synthetase B (glutamine-hydrolysing)